jgi:hypothetical protein
MGVGEGGGRRLDSDSRRLHYRVRPLRGSWGSGQLLFAERAYPSPRASTDFDVHYAGSTTFSSHGSSCGARYYSDSDHAGDIDTSKSTSGILFFLAKCLVSWQL